jgi:hypothetical protein
MKAMQFRDAAVAATVSAALLLSAGASQAAANLSGFWMLKTDPISVPQAASTPAAAAKVRALLDARGPDAPNGSPAYAWAYCTPEGLPWQTTHALPMDIRQAPHALTMSFVVESDPRHVYLDGQPHPDTDIFDFTSVGHSIGRWQGETLVVSTRYFKDGSGVLVIPGGALRSENSRLTERFRLVDKDHLRVTHTWTDSTTLRRPHTYTFDYERAPSPMWMVESQCDPIKAMRIKGLPLPPDAPQ